MSLRHRSFVESQVRKQTKVLEIYNQLSSLPLPRVAGLVFHYPSVPTSDNRCLDLVTRKLTTNVRIMAKRGIAERSCCFWNLNLPAIYRIHISHGRIPGVLDTLRIDIPQFFRPDYKLNEAIYSEAIKVRIHTTEITQTKEQYLYALAGMKRLLSLLFKDPNLCILAITQQKSNVNETYSRLEFRVVFTGEQRYSFSRALKTWECLFVYHIHSSVVTQHDIVIVHPIPFFVRPQLSFAGI